MKQLLSIVAAMFLMQTFATAQEKEPPADITGMWKGYLLNDTTKKKIAYELAISDESGKLVGYSFSAFEDSGKREIGVKKMRFKRKGDKLVVEDVEMLTNTYSQGVPKGIHMKGEMGLTLTDTLMTYDGTWSTNPTKFYKPVTGSMHVERKRNFKDSSELYAKLKEMKLEKDLSFVKNPPSDVAVVKKPTPPPPVAVVEPKPKPVVKKEPEVKKVAKATKPTPPPVVKPVEPVKEVAVAPVIKEPAADVAKRRIANTQSVFYKSDSLILSLYDNGEVDGDTVSILMNGQLIYSKQGLSTKANSKTIYITKDTPDSLVLVMYAENLGSIPPNTGLLVVRDGEQTYDVRFSADLNSNAEIILMRRKEGQ